MAEEKLDEVEQPLPSKRKPSSPQVESPQNSSKLQKLQPNSPPNSPYTNKQNGSKYEDEDGDEEDDYEESEDEEEEDGGGEIDRKGKGVMKEDPKGKGKLIEESENDSSDDDDDDDDDDEVGSGFEEEEEDESDLDEDPLAEVDLDNILPSRTRGRPPRPGVTFLDNPSKDQNK